ncbi:MAG: hypothetical protein NTX17_00200 [Candidatus Eisenbacteria bacterium]|nr:hypothetical protein [Candidatus Eisenbacteria bacterium]
MHRHEEFLLREYDLAAKLTYHIDDLRNKLTSFFLSFAAAAGAALVILVKGEARAFLTNQRLGVLCLGIAILGGLVVGILARCRRAQIEHFRIINNVREYFLGRDYDLWNVVQLSGQTLPVPNRRSGTFMWTALIMVVDSSLVSLSLYLILSSTLASWFLVTGAFLVAWLVLDRLYFRLARPPEEIRYSASNPPDGACETRAHARHRCT